MLLCNDISALGCLLCVLQPKLVIVELCHSSHAMRWTAVEPTAALPYKMGVTGNSLQQFRGSHPQSCPVRGQSDFDRKGQTSDLSESNHSNP